jgi:hypothetical protein
VENGGAPPWGKCTGFLSEGLPVLSGRLFCFGSLALRELGVSAVKKDLGNPTAATQRTPSKSGENLVLKTLCVLGVSVVKKESGSPTAQAPSTQ